MGGHWWEWVFSGIGVLALSAVGVILFRRNQGTKRQQSQRSGAGSTNLQAGRDITVDAHGRESDGE